MNLDRKIHFYFDFLSPFGYFGSLRINELAKRHDLECEWHPILLGVSVLKVMGLPPIAELPLKGAYIRNDAARYSRRHKIKLGRRLGAPQVNPLLPARIVSWLKLENYLLAQNLAADLYSAHWQEDKDISERQVAFQIAQKNGIDVVVLSEAIESGEASAALRAEVDASIGFGVFGSPTFRMGEELFFGVEKLEVFDEWLKLGGW